MWYTCGVVNTHSLHVENNVTALTSTRIAARRPMSQCDELLMLRQQRDEMVHLLKEHRFLVSCLQGSAVNNFLPE